MPLSRKRTRLYAKGLLTALERYPTKLDKLLNAFIAILKDNRHLRYHRSILESLADILEESGGTIQVKSSSAFPLSSRSTHTLEHFLEHLPQATYTGAAAGGAPGIHLTTASYHWDGRVTTILKQLGEQLTH